jgi:hypothetical protein
VARDAATEEDVYGLRQFGDPDPEYAKRTGGAEHLMHGGTGVSGA